MIIATKFFAENP